MPLTPKSSSLIVIAGFLVCVRIFAPSLQYTATPPSRDAIKVLSSHGTLNLYVAWNHKSQASELQITPVEGVTGSTSTDH